jgi:hypothetical protein
VTVLPQTDNVWDVDCTGFFPSDKINAVDVHGAYFNAPETIELIRQILRGIDRDVLKKSGVAGAANVPGSA